MADRNDNRPYRGILAERDEPLASEPRMSRDRPQNWSVFDSEIPIKSLVWWYLKIGIPALVFVAISAAICYGVVSFLMGQEIKGATRQLEKEMSNSSLFQPTQRKR